jgi:uncharacterized protein
MVNYFDHNGDQNSPVEGRGRDLQANRPAFCSYCNAELNPFYYFCLRCATPYTSAKSVLPPEQTPYINDRQRVALKAPHASALFWSYFSVIFFTYIIGAAFQIDDNPAELMILAAVLIALVTLIFGVMHWTALKVQFGRFGFNRWEAWAGVAAVVPMVLLALGYQYFIEMITPVECAGKSIEDLGLSRGGVLLMFCVFPAITEEIAFRGLLQHWLRAAIGPQKALLIASALFAGLHLSIATFPVLFLMGMLMGWTKQRTGSLYPSMLIHFSYNLVIIAASTEAFAT